MPHLVRVRDRDTGHEYDLDAAAVDPAAHTKVTAPGRWPDLHGDGARPRPPLHRTDKAGHPVTLEKNRNPDT